MNLDRKSSAIVAPEIERQIMTAIADIKFGSVEIVIHDGKIVQIESREKTRIETNSSPSR